MSENVKPETDVKRYYPIINAYNTGSLFPDMLEGKAGEYVRYENYASLTEELREAREHERQTHETLGAILGIDDTLENKALSLTEGNEKLRTALRAAEERARESEKWSVAHQTDIQIRNSEITRLTAEVEEWKKKFEEAKGLYEGCLVDMDADAFKVNMLAAELSTLRRESVRVDALLRYSNHIYRRMRANGASEETSEEVAAYRLHDALTRRSRRNQRETRERNVS